MKNTPSLNFDSGFGNFAFIKDEVKNISDPTVKKATNKLLKVITSLKIKDGEIKADKDSNNWRVFIIEHEEKRGSLVVVYPETSRCAHLEKYHTRDSIGKKFGQYVDMDSCNIELDIKSDTTVWNVGTGFCLD